MSGARAFVKSATQLVRFGMVGLIINLAGYLLFLLITNWGFEPKKTMTFIYLVGVAISFVGNRQWTFVHRGTVFGSSTRYLIVHICGYTINLLVLIIFVDRLDYSHELVQAVAMFFLAGFFFIGSKYFVFPKAKPSNTGVE